MLEEPAPADTSLRPPPWATHQIPIADEAIEYYRTIGVVTPRNEEPIVVQVVQRDEKGTSGPNSVSRGPAALLMRGVRLEPDEVEELIFWCTLALNEMIGRREPGPTTRPRLEVIPADPTPVAMPIRPLKSGVG